MNAILVNNFTVQKVTLSDDSDVRYSEMQALIGCRMLTGAGYPDQHHAAYADDEGLLTLSDGASIIETTFHTEPLVGNLLITGFDPETGEDQDCTLSVARVNAMITNRGIWYRRRA